MKVARIHFEGYNFEMLQAERICRKELNRPDCFSWKGPNNEHLVQLPDHFKADTKLQLVIKGIVQLPLKQ